MDPAVGIALVFLALAFLGYSFCRAHKSRQQEYARVQLYEDRPFAYGGDGDDAEPETPPYARAVAHVPQARLVTPWSGALDEEDVTNVQSLIKAELAESSPHYSPRR